MEAKIKHLEFIQNTIDRMSHNSFLLKGWNITIIGALFALTFKESNIQYLYVSGIITALFWLLDGYFLSRERLFIKLFDNVRKLNESKVDFSMDVKKFQHCCNWVGAIFSKTLMIFYGGIIIIHLILTYLI